MVRAHGSQMIVVKLMGGLGNQMFQYAAARRLSQVSGVPLKLDLRWFDTVGGATTKRPYQLHPFRIVESVATPEETAALDRPLGKLAGFARRYIPMDTPYLKERHFHFDPDILRPRCRAYLDGFWQSEKYFADVRELIAADFAFKEAPAGRNAELAAEILEGGGSVSLHIRRGDYVQSADVASFHGVCSPRYYDAAVEEVASRVPAPHFFIFSDDPAWVSAHFRIGHPFTVVSHNSAQTPCEDLRLISLCRHHIIANSTFSWWGAWLASGSQKVVVAPRAWFNQAPVDPKDVVPETWTTI